MENGLQRIIIFMFILFMTATYTNYMKNILINLPKRFLEILFTNVSTGKVFIWGYPKIDQKAIEAGNVTCDLEMALHSRRDSRLGGQTKIFALNTGL